MKLLERKSIRFKSEDIFWKTYLLFRHEAFADDKKDVCEKDHCCIFTCSP